MSDDAPGDAAASDSVVGSHKMGVKCHGYTVPYVTVAYINGRGAVLHACVFCGGADAWQRPQHSLIAFGITMIATS